jgi:long-chain fatty acid transport protein
MTMHKKTVGAFTLAAAALTAGATAAMAGGYAVREQSTVFQGSGFAGAAAGGSLGAMYWNSAATAQFSGLSVEASYTLILPNADVSVESIGGFPAGLAAPGINTESGDIGIDALVGASYASYQISQDVWVGMAINSPFGLATKPEDINYAGSVLGRTTKLLTINANPTVAYKLAPGITVGAGMQIEWARGKLQFASGGPAGPTTQFKGDDFAFGATAGIMIEPAAGTSIGLGYRSRLTHKLEGDFDSFGPSGAAFTTGAIGEIKLPDIVTLSLRQAITPDFRLLGTVEWSNWSRFSELTLSPDLPIGDIEIAADWSDGWFFALGGEYDYSSTLTLRGGLSYELSPVGSPEKRFTTIPDADRFWVNAGLSYKYSEATTIDFAYSHLFVEDADFERHPVGSPVQFTGSVDASVDLISFGMRTRW